MEKGKIAILVECTKGTPVPKLYTPLVLPFKLCHSYTFSIPMRYWWAESVQIASTNKTGYLERLFPKFNGTDVI